jgi:ribosome maturation factor RimP
MANNLSNSIALDQLIGPVVMAMGYQLWGCDFNSGKHSAQLRVFIDSPLGVSVDDCARVSHQLGGVLDAEDLIRGPYTLEVSSPGLDRLLFQPAQYRCFIGETVKLRLRWLIEGHRNITGKLQAVDEGKIIVKQAELCYAIPLEAIDRARLVPEL